jgi:NitT/TauT family transport system ATP-binding protein
LVKLELSSQSQATEVLSLEGVSKTFVTADGTVRALDPVDLTIRRNEFVSLIGPSGCGKSTLFGIIGGLMTDYDGSVLLGGRRVRGPQPEIGMVFQEESTFPWRTTLQNIAFPLEVKGMPRAEREERARHFLRLVGLDGFENRRPAELSGGMRQRTALARTLASEPEIILMDEPFASLDEQTRILLGDKLLQIWQELHQTTLLITHNIAEAVQLSDRVVVMSFRPGRIKQIVEVDLPRPRSSDILGSERFGHLVGLIWNDLREEATRGLAESEGKR